MWHQLGPPARRQSPVRALCSVILGFTLLAATLALVLSWLLATGILDPGAPARAQAARKLDLTRLPEPTNDLERLPKPTELPASTSAPTSASPAATTRAFDPLPSCQAPGFLCKDGLTCVGPAQVCDGISQCPRHEEGEGGEDEEGCASSGGGEVASTVASVTADEDDSSVTTKNAVTTTEQSDVSDDKKDFPEVKLEREDNEVEIDAESEKETSVEEFGGEQPRSFS